MQIIDMFSSTKPNVIVSDEGYSVEILGRTGIKYCEGDKCMFVDSEVLSTGHGIAVFKKSIKAWKPPHEKEGVTEEKKEKIIDNIRQAIAFQKQPIEIL